MGKVGFGIDHEMRDFWVNRSKNLDLVICTPADGMRTGASLVELAEKWELPLTPAEAKILSGLPDLLPCKVGSTLVALEAKACMTEHVKARPRLYDELSSSWQTILGDTRSAIAAGFVPINTADTFVSPLRNTKPLGRGRPDETIHEQPKATQRVLEKIAELPRRSDEDTYGFDAVGVSLIECRNDGSDVKLIESLSDGTEVDEILRYESMVLRIANIYSSRFRAL